MMIEKRAIDPVESILQCRRMIEWMASIPKETFQLSNVMTHITSREMSKIFDVDMIFVFIIDSENKNQISKYSIRADTCETHLLSDTISSLVGEVINKEKILKFSQVILPEFNASIDGCPGILIQNFLSVPIKIQKSSEIIGVIHFINKCNGKVAFTELDEIISTLFASMTVSSILGCRKYQHLNYRADVLKSILSSPSALLSLLPSRDSSYKIKTHVGDILKVLENTFKVPLKCLKVKVFILSDFVYGCQKRLLVSRKDEGKYGLQFRRDSIPPLDYHSVNLGIPGHVMTSKNWSIATDGDIDMHYNPIVDIDSKGKSCVCVPIFNVEGDVIVCVEMILGPLSPKIHLAESRADGINFEEALQCLILSISAPLQLVIERIYENDGQKASLLKGSEDESSPVLHKCDSCDTVKEEIFASFSIEEKAHEDDQLNHLLSLGIIPSKISHDTVNSSESKILPTSSNHSSNSNSPRTLRTRRRLSV